MSIIPVLSRLKENEGLGQSGLQSEIFSQTNKNPFDVSNLSAHEHQMTRAVKYKLENVLRS